MTRRILAAVGLAFALVGLPSAAAQDLPSPTIEIELSTSHPEGHPYELPDSRRLQVPLDVRADAANFACILEAQVWVTGILDGFPEWAGASIDPNSAQASIPAGQPGLGENSYQTGGFVLDIFWGDNAPHDTPVTYSISTLTRLDGGPCLPSPQVEEDEFEITVVWRS